MSIHHLSYVQEDCAVAHSALVMQFASVLRRSEICAQAMVSPNAVVDASFVGAKSIVGPGAFLSPGSLVEYEVFIGPGVVLCNDAWPRTHKKGFPQEELLRLNKKTVIVEPGASIGANAVVLPGIKIGERAMIAAGAVVTESVPPECLWTREGEMRAIQNEEGKTRVRYA